MEIEIKLKTIIEAVLLTLVSVVMFLVTHDLGTTTWFVSIYVTISGISDIITELIGLYYTCKNNEDNNK